MHRPLWFRVLFLALGVWFPLTAGEPGLFDPCPMHGAFAVSRSHVTGAGTMAMQHTMAASAHHHSPKPGHQHHDCTCIGCCSVAGTALRAPEPATVEIAAVVVSTRRLLPTVAALPRPAPAFARPYTTGPPRVLA